MKIKLRLDLHYWAIGLALPQKMIFGFKEDDSLDERYLSIIYLGPILILIWL